MRETDIVIACVRDEADIIEAFVDFYLEQGFDRLCLVDNGSIDGTLERLQDHPRRAQLVVERDSRIGYDGRLLEYEQRFGPLASRWIFFLDVDEFVLLPAGIKGFAGELPPIVNTLTLPSFEMLPELAAPAGSSPLCSRRRERNWTGETKVVWKTGVVTAISCGKHRIEGPELVAHRDARVFIRHFHTRSERQFRRKLENRLETAREIARDRAFEDAHSASTFEARRSWMAESQALLEEGGWARECERIRRTRSVEDGALCDWLDRHAGGRA